MDNLKIEEIKLVISYDASETDSAFDSVIESVVEGELHDNYKLIAFSNPIEYELNKKEMS